jgi:hypothetical protein
MGVRAVHQLASTFDSCSIPFLLHPRSGRSSRPHADRRVAKIIAHTPEHRARPSIPIHPEDWLFA